MRSTPAIDAFWNSPVFTPLSICCLLRRRWTLSTIKISQYLKNQYHQRPRLWQILFILIAAFFLLRHCSLWSRHPAPPSQLVVSATAKTQDVPVYLPALGTVTATYTITVRTQINGQLLKVLFREGQMVKTGELLAQIDPRPYEAQLIQYQGQLAHDQALLANAKLDLIRYRTLWSQNSISKQTYDTQAYLVKQYEGTVNQDQGLIEGVKLNLIYCNILSPVDGRIGLRLVDPGNYVQTSDTNGLAVVDTLNPITVIFVLPEDDVQSVLKQLKANKTLTAKAYDREQNKLLATGTLLTIDNQIDPTTGTVKLRAEFKNDNNLLFPNQFVNIQLLTETLKNAVVIPTSAIQYGAQGTYVYLIRADHTVTPKPVVTGITSNDVIVITSGLSSGQAVVTEGVDKLTEGTHITLAAANNNAPRQQQTL